MQSLHLPDGAKLTCSSLRLRNNVRKGLGVGPGQLRASSRAVHPEGVRLQLAQQFPNTLLLQGHELPSLYNSKHFVNLTNGLELAPLLNELQLSFSVVRIRSTNLEQQSFEALMLELDANLLLAMALGHSCIIWDCGCRNRHNGAPRAIWYGLEFIRFALNKFWLGRSTPAHLRGYNVADTFEAACRKFHPSTKNRLRYYKRYLTDAVQQDGVSVYGLFRRTEHDEDVDFFVQKAAEWCGVKQNSAAHGLCCSSCEHVGGAAASCSASLGNQQPLSVSEDQGFQECRAALDALAYDTLVDHGMGIFAAGLSHTQFSELRDQQGVQQQHPAEQQQQQHPAEQQQQQQMAATRAHKGLSHTDAPH